MAFTFTINGNTYSSDPASSAPDGYRFVGYGYITALANLAQDIVTLMASQVAAAAAKVDLATAQANSAALSAATALNAPGTSATSTTALTISVGSKALTIQTGKNLVPGMNVAIANSVAPDNGMFGPVTSYNTGTGALVVNATQVTGSGVGVATWTVSISGPAAPAIINELKGADIASAATINLDSATGNLVHVTGSVAITAITLASGRERKVVFDSALTLTFNAVSLILPGAVNIITAPGDSMIVVGDGAGSVRVISYNRASNVPGQVVRSTRTANIALAPTDNRSYIDIVSGTFTQVFGVPATLGAGWSCRVGNSGTGDITIPLSDGMANWPMYPGEIRDFYCDGVTFVSRILHVYRRDFLSSAIWGKAPGYKMHGGLAWSGAGSGDKRLGGSAAIGGAGGGAWPFTIDSSLLPATVAVTIGAGGAPVTTAATDGNSGGNTSFGGFFTVIGGLQAGSGNTIGGAIQNGLTGFALTGPAANASIGFNSQAANSNSSANSVYGGTTPAYQTPVAAGNSVYGGAAGGSCTTSNTLTPAGTSLHGGNGGPAGINVSGTDGTAPGGGGGATQTGPQSGAGARGELRIWGIV